MITEDMQLRSGLKVRDGRIMSGEGDTDNIQDTEELNSSSMTGKSVAPGRTVRMLGYEFNSVAAVTHLSIMVYAMCFFIQQSTLPYLTKKLGVDPVMYGYLETTFAILQLGGGPLFGRFGDIFGGRAALGLAFASSSMTYGILGVSYTVPILFFSRLPVIFMHAMQAGQMVMTDISDSAGRADALGKLSLSYGVGMVVGPFIGGLITNYGGEQMAALVASALSVITLVGCVSFVPSQTKKSHVAEKQKGAGQSMLNISKWGSILSHPRALLLLSVKTVTGIPLGAFQTMFAVVAMDIFKLAPHENGYVMSYIGLLVMVIQGLGIGLLTKRFSEESLIKYSNFILIWAWLLQAYVQNIWQFCLVMVPKAFGLAVQNVVISSTLTKIVPEADTGAMLGINMAVHSLVRTVSPTMGGYMLKNLGFASFGYFGCIVSIIVTVFLFSRLRE